MLCIELINVTVFVPGFAFNVLRSKEHYKLSFSYMRHEPCKIQLYSASTQFGWQYAPGAVASVWHNWTMLHSLS
jgi:hypothetical protein